MDDSRENAGLTVNDSKFAPAPGGGFLVITGPSMTYWNPANKATGNYTVEATFAEKEYMNLNTHPHPYGIAIAGNDLGTPTMSILYCSAYGNGTFIVRGFGPAPFAVNARAEANAAINKAAGKGSPVTQKIAMTVTADKVECAVNGTIVGSYDKAGRRRRRQAQVNRRRLRPALRTQHRSRGHRLRQEVAARRRSEDHDSDSTLSPFRSRRARRWRSSPPAPRARSKPQAAQQPAAPAGPLAPEKYKDIQVLKDVPADQLDLTMRYFVAATGLQLFELSRARSGDGRVHVRSGHAHQDDGAQHDQARADRERRRFRRADQLRHVSRRDAIGRRVCSRRMMMTPDQLAARWRHGRAARAGRGRRRRTGTRRAASRRAAATGRRGRGGSRGRGRTAGRGSRHSAAGTGDRRRH